MNHITKVFLITGFLGSGKTTLLNRIVEHFPKDKKLTILMNEFGEIGIDGTLVEGEDIDMMEISRGSIFCVCVKTDFIKGLYELNTTIRPDVLLIESTGVANPTDLKRDLKLPIFNDRFQYSEQFCIIDALHFAEAYEVFSAVEKQISSSTIFIINKTDKATAGQITHIKEMVAKHHPAPVFFETTFSNIPLDQFILNEQNQEVLTLNATAQAALTPDELEKYIDDLLDQPSLQITPPDQLVSTTSRWLGNDLAQINSMAQKLPSSIVRAKGFVKQGEQIYIFSFVMGDWTIEESTIDPERINHMNVVVFIGPLNILEAVNQVLDSAEWSKKT